MPLIWAYFVVADVDFPMLHGGASMREIDLFYNAMMKQTTTHGVKPTLSLSPGGNLSSPNPHTVLTSSSPCLRNPP